MFKGEISLKNCSVQRLLWQDPWVRRENLLSVLRGSCLQPPLLPAEDVKAMGSWEGKVSNDLLFPCLLARSLSRISFQHYQIELLWSLQLFSSCLVSFPSREWNAFVPNCRAPECLHCTELLLPSPKPEEQAAQDNQCLDVIGTQMRNMRNVKDTEKDFFIFLAKFAAPVKPPFSLL